MKRHESWPQVKESLAEAEQYDVKMANSPECEVNRDVSGAHGSSEKEHDEETVGDQEAVDGEAVDGQEVDGEALDGEEVHAEDRRQEDRRAQEDGPQEHPQVGGEEDRLTQAAVPYAKGRGRQPRLFCYPLVDALRRRPFPAGEMNGGRRACASGGR